tara:strand:+ start:31 stop:306 length:276 start_codon:yes stop_codon:yes gene_type:complete
MPASPKDPISKLVASAEAKILTKLLPIKIAPMSIPSRFWSLFTVFARLFPLDSSWCISGREATVSAVSEPEKKADKINNTPIATRDIIMME